MPVTPEAAAQADLTDFLEKETILSMEQREANFQAEMKLFNKFRPIVPSTRFFEIGTGSGWFQVNCLRNGIACEGIELTPQLADSARSLGSKYGVEPKIRLGNIEEDDIGVNLYDFVLAESLLEHVPNWKLTVRKAYDALKPGGVFYMCSTNKFSFVSGEFPRVPLYGWFPDGARRWIRIKLQGPGVMLWCMDVNQFRYPMLRKFFKQVGFTDVFDYVEMKQADELNTPTALRRVVMKILKSSRLAKRLFLTFKSTTVFLCRK